MKGTLRKSMNWLHTWSGLLVGWVLYFMFITGTAGYVDTEIDRWMHPEIPVSINVSSTEHLLALAEKRLNQNAAKAKSWSINFPVDRNSPFFSIRWQIKKDRFDEVLDVITGQVIDARDTGGGRTLYRMHYRLHYMSGKTATWIVGICSMFMLIGLVSGIIIHKRIFKDMFTFRPGKSNKLWLDMHNVFSVLALPFHLMITYSGLLFFAFTTMPWIVSASYGLGEENKRHFFDETFGSNEKVKSAGVTAPMVSLSNLLIDVEKYWGKDQVSSIQIENYNDVNARVIVRQHRPNASLARGERLTYDGVSGELLNDSSEHKKDNPASNVRGVLLTTHEGLFAGVLLRSLYFLSGVFGAGMIASGLVLWVRRKRLRASKTKTPKGLALVERLNVATIIGLLIAIAAYLLSNRLLDIDIPDRADKEVAILFSVWAASLIYASFRTVSQAWTELLWLAAVLYTSLPLVNYFTTQRHLLISLVEHDFVMAGFDLVLLVFGITFAAAAMKQQRKRQ